MTVRLLKFLKPDERQKVRSQEKFQRLLRKSLRVASELLLLSILLFVGHRTYVCLLEDPSFRVREIEIEGCAKLNHEGVQSLLLIEGMPNLFTVRLGEMARRIETHPWVDHVMMQKVFPNKLKIRIEERKPMAILQLEEFYYIDAKGVVFSPVRDGDGYNFPFLTGLTRQALEKEAETSKSLIRMALEFLRIAEGVKVAPLQEISEIHMSRAYGIDCFAKTSGLEVRLGKDHFDEKLRRLTTVWSDLKKKGLSAMSIDCSDVNRIVVKRVSSG